MQEVYIDPSTGTAVVVDEGLDGAQAIEALMASAEYARMNEPAKAAMQAVASWVSTTRKPKGKIRRGSIFDRDAYVSPESPLEQMATARMALADDIVGGAADGTEAIALTRATMVVKDADQREIWRQWLKHIKFDRLMREMWRTMFTDSQVVLAWLPQRVSFAMKGKGDQAARRKIYENLLVPGEACVLPSDKVAPLGSPVMGREFLVYIANDSEAAAFDAVLAQRGERRNEAYVNARTATVEYQHNLWLGLQEGTTSLTDDDVVERLVVERYDPTPGDIERLRRFGVKRPTHLYRLDPRYVTRFTRTRAAGQWYADVRLASCFELLDIKRQLRHRDRTVLLAGANFIITVTLGLDENKKGPHDSELEALHASVKSLAEVPVMVGDQRLEVKIVQVKDEGILDRDKHDTPDVRLFARAWGSFVPTGGSANDDPMRLGRVISVGLEDRRLMLLRAVEETLIDFMFEANEDLTEEPSLHFPPIMLQFDQAWLMALLELREKKEISRGTVLEGVGLIQPFEATMREIEQEVFDEIFGTLDPPGSGGGDPNPDEPDQPALGPGQQRGAGRREGGLRHRGGAAPGTRQGQKPVRLPSKRQIREAKASLLRREAVALNLRPGRAPKAELIDMLLDNLDRYQTDPPNDEDDLDA
jgi:hypothetical protein